MTKPLNITDALTFLANRINVEHDAAEVADKAVEAAFKKGVSHAMACGDNLIKAKAMLEHGRWLPWLAKYCPKVSERKAQRYMRLAHGRETIEAKSDTMSDLTMREAMNWLAPEKPEPKEDDSGGPSGQEHESGQSGHESGQGNNGTGTGNGTGDTFDSDEWGTPQALFDRLNAVHHFTADACATPQNAKCAKFYTKEQDGLAQSWAGETVWVNPPYSNIEPWMEKAHQASLEGAIVVAVVPSWTDRDWWHDYAMKGEIEYIRGRLRFERPDAKSNNPTFPNAIVIFRPPQAQGMAPSSTCPHCAERHNGLDVEAYIATAIQAAGQEVDSLKEKIERLKNENRRLKETVR